MAETLYSDALIGALKDNAAALADAPDQQAVEKVISRVQKEAAETTPSYTADRIIYRITVTVLGVSVLLVIIAQVVITLADSADKIPEGLIAIGSAAIGALAGLLAPTPAR